MVTPKAVSTFSGPKYFIKKADTESLRQVFLKYASHENNGEFFMTSHDFICRFLKLIPLEPTTANTTTNTHTTIANTIANITATTAANTTAVAKSIVADTKDIAAAVPATDTEHTTVITPLKTDVVKSEELKKTEAVKYVVDDVTVRSLANAVDTTNNGLISFAEFQAFESILIKADSVYQIAFSIFDKNSNAILNYDEFHTIVSRTFNNSKTPFDFSSPFIKLHFGADLKKNVNYEEFTQLLHDFHDEHALQAFKVYDENHSGYIKPAHFKEIMTSLKSHLMTDVAKDTLFQMFSGSNKHTSKAISYAYFIAVISLLNNMELIKQIHASCVRSGGDDDDAGVTKEELLLEAQKYTQLTPLEVNILFQMVSYLNPTGKMSFRDIKKLAPLDTEVLPIHYQEMAIQDALMETRGVVIQIIESAYRFTLGSLAGATGATAVYPIDLVKTRLQNQRISSDIGEKLYKNSLDCFRKVIKFEGVAGLYRGLLPQIVGVAPEKAIKLTVNDLVRDKMATRDGKIPVWAEVLAGACAGACQVIFTNPLEIVKIRLQVAGEIATTRRLGAMEVVKDLGVRGLYKGAPACLLRDIPFSGIFFPLYAHLKKFSANKEGYNSIPSLLASATVAGAPAAALCTPADVIKTRLQVVARKGQSTYTGIFDCIRKVVAEEGFMALWKGAPARVLRSSPQFGVTLATYELLQRAFDFDFGGRQLAGSVKSSLHHPHTTIIPPSFPDHIGGYKLALAAFDGMESKFGLVFPKYKRVVE